MKSLATAALLTALATTASAQDVGDTSVAFGLSNFGGNIEAAYRINPSYRVRGAFMGGFSFEYEESDIDGDFEGDFDLGGFAVLGDFYPMQSSWRVSGGLFFSNTELDATGTADIEGETDPVSLNTNATFNNEVAPMITTGFDWAFAEGWTFNSEVGLIFIGGLDIDFTASNPALQDEVDNDPDIQSAQSDADDLFALPYLGFTVGYQF